MRIWNKATAEPWAITETALQTILDIASRENEAPEAVAAKLGKELQNTHSVTERDGVAVMRDLGNPKITPAANPDEEDADTVAKRVAKAA